MNKPGWVVTESVYKTLKDLPRGFEFREDVDFLYVYKDDKLIAVYNSKYANPVDVAWRLKKYGKDTNI